MQVRKKLLQINIVVNFGSTGRIVEELGKVAIGSDWESYIAYGRHERSSKSELIRIGSAYDINLHVLKTRLFDRHGFGSKRATLELVERIKMVKPDIIHLHNIHGYYINIKILFDYLAGAKVPVVWTFHDCWPITGHCVYFDYIHCEKWKTECSECPQKSSYPASYFLDSSTQNFKLKKKLFSSLKNLTIVPVSNWLADIVKQSFLSDFPISVINNGVDISLFHPVDNNTIRERHDLKGKCIILGVANIWDQRKGLSDFIELSKKLSTDHQIILIGLNKKQILGLPGNILGIERTEDMNQLAEFYSAADVFVNPSLEETFGLTTAEALACGTPVIVYNSTANPEMVSSDTGFVVEKGNIKELVEKIKLIQEIGKDFFSHNCVNRARTLYNKNERFKEYLQLYEKLLLKNP
jgi:glycosyltransferase involved in cell wall biosynthesis